MTNLGPDGAVEVAKAKETEHRQTVDALDRIDRWWRWEHDRPHTPRRQSTAEYQELMARSSTPWLGLVVTAVSQALRVEGYRGSTPEASARAWGWWQASGMDARQAPIHQSALAYGWSYGRVLPGLDPLTGDRVPVMRGISPRRMTAFYSDRATDEWPEFACLFEPKELRDPATGRTVKGTEATIYDSATTYLLRRYTEGGDFALIDAGPHGAPVCPVVQYRNRPDLEGRTPGEVEPFISVAARIDQTTFDRLVVQRFASWVVRTIAGMAQPESAEDAQAEKLRLRVEDILIAEDNDTKFGSLPATPLEGFIAAKEADVRDLAAVTQTPPSHLLGEMVNLSAEALASAEASLGRKVGERKSTFGESHEQMIRLAGSIMGDVEVARDMSAQVNWADVESRSLAQAADAYSKLVAMGVPLLPLLRKLPGFTDQDVAEIEEMLAEIGPVDEMMRELMAGTASVEVPAGLPVG